MDSSADIRKPSLCNLKMCNTVSLSTAATLYNMMGLKIIKVLPKSKGAYGKGWTDPQYSDGLSHWETNPNDNIGIPLGRNQLFVVDIDNMELYNKSMAVIKDKIMLESGVDIPFFEVDTIHIVSGRPGSGKLVFTIPDDIVDKLEYHSLKWAGKNGNKGITIVEFRCGDNLQDIAPPSIHPSGTKYQWEGKTDGPVEMPKDLQELVLNWDKYENTMLKLNPDYVNPPKPIVRDGKKYTGTNYIDMWDNMQDLCSMLEQYGYKRIGQRYISPDSSSGSPGIVIMQGGRKFYSHGESDYFGSGPKKTVHDAFDLLMHYEFNDEFKPAYEYILKDMGITKEMINNNRTRTFWEGTDDW